MFDLVDVIKSKSSAEKEKEVLTTVLFHQTEECKQLIEEAYRFEDIAAPSVLENQDSLIQQHVREENIEIVIVELNKSKSVMDDMHRISHLLPNSASVIVIGSEDSISTIRNLKSLGYYYVFWPISKQELIDFVRNVNENRNKNSGLGKGRAAKKVCVWGAKGGVGASFITAALSMELSKDKNSSCLVVEHNFSGGNLDIFLAVSQFKKREVSRGALANSLDETYALSMTRKIHEMLHVLALESNDIADHEMKDYVRTISENLSGQYNFIVEDLSSSANSLSDLTYVGQQADVLVLVLEPTVSSLREAAFIQAKMEELGSTTRCITVLNHTMHERSATVTVKDVEKFLNRKLDVVCPYEPQLGKWVLEGKAIFQEKQAISSSLNTLTSLLLGEAIKPKRESIFKRLFRGQ
ncbi:chromosome partitioning protein ParA [Vibrio sp. SCSIO 43135]|uniref:AAA family ATPase n=1 Tax=Vibrio sp. SCSIO 43135 TaxID=2819096 RepID=UPI0020754347|nr:chromosome partitioning protein ParA [Vibrio sp. SCSIO 43135]USD40139.1 chromosome partitioning protein ParA [Vibrio sp. SCSIO 43135]